MERRVARNMVRRAIIRGELVPSDMCEQCGKTPIRKKRRPIEAHHHNGYSDEHALDVIWLCASCHKLAHPETNIWTEARKQKVRDTFANKPKVVESAERKAQRREAALKTKPWAADRSNAYSDERRANLSNKCKETKPWLGRG